VVDLAELNGFGGTCLCASRRQAVLEPVVAEGAFLSETGVGAGVDDAKRARGDAIAATVARRLVDVHGVEFSAQDGARRAYLQARGIDAMFAHIRHHQPGGLLAIRVGAELLDKLDMPPINVGKAPRVVVAVAAENRQAPAKPIWLRRTVTRRQVVPLMA